MPFSEVLQDAQVYPATGPYNLEIEMVLANGETSSSGYFYQYSSGEPLVNFGFGTETCYSVPEGWQLTDIGYRFRSGSLCTDSLGEEFEIRSWSEGYSAATYDRLTMLYRPMSSVDTLICRVLSVSPVWNDLGGIMMRNSTDSAAAFAAISSLDTRGVFWQWRSSNGAGNAYEWVTEQAMPMWLRLTRSQNLVKGFYSQDGQNWTLYYSRSINLGSNPVAGVVTVKNGARARFDHLRLSSAGAVTGVLSSEFPLVPHIFPNPTDGNSFLNWESESEGIMELEVRETGGRVVRIQHISVTKGRNQLELNKGNLPSGIYFLKVRTGNKQLFFKWILK
jgi:hypothetical protein